MSAFEHAAFSNVYRQLGERFSTAQLPQAVKKPGLIRLNRELGEFLGLPAGLADDEDTAQFLAGNRIAEASEPIATVYAGHQFGSWNPQLGDGRAVLLGELRGRDGALYEIQLKGSGQTPYSSQARNLFQRSAHGFHLLRECGALFGTAVRQNATIFSQAQGVGEYQFTDRFL